MQLCDKLNCSQLHAQLMVDYMDHILTVGQVQVCCSIIVLSQARFILSLFFD